MEKLLATLTMILSMWLFLASPSQAQSSKKQQNLSYDITCGGSGSQGYYIVDVTVHVKKAKEITSSLFQKCAVHGVLFRGFSGSNGCTSQRPLAGSALNEQQHSEFYIPFFKDGGGYSTYASVIGGVKKTVKEGKELLSTATVSVSKEQLRKDLEKAGVLKGLSNGF